MTELERYKEAMKIALDVLDVCTRHMENERYTASTIADLARINAILNPQEFENVEVVRWLCLYCGVTTMHDTNEPPDGNYCCQHHVGHTKLTGTIRRPIPQKVERSASAKDVLIDNSNEGSAIWPHDARLIGDADWESIVGKRVDVTFTWTE